MIVICSNTTGWNEEAGSLVPGGMVDRIVAPIVRHLEPSEYVIGRYPQKGAVNVYVSMPTTYGDRFIDGGVLANHGCADKGIRRASRFGKGSRYAYVIVPGPLVAARSLGPGVPPDRIVELGYSKLDPFFLGEVPARRRTDDRIRVVYAPTHGGGGEAHIGDTRDPRIPAARRTSWWKRDQVLSHLDPDVFDVTLAPHPRHRPDRRATFEEYAGADVVIADGGSTIYEAWALGFPVVFPGWLTRQENVRRNTIEGYIYRHRIGTHVTAPHRLADAVRRAAADGISQAEHEYSLQMIPASTRGVSGKLHAEFLRSLVDQHDGGQAA